MSEEKTDIEELFLVIVNTRGDSGLIIHYLTRNFLKFMKFLQLIYYYVSLLRKLFSLYLNLAIQYP